MDGALLNLTIRKFAVRRKVTWYLLGHTGYCCYIFKFTDSMKDTCAIIQTKLSKTGYSQLMPLDISSIKLCAKLVKNID